jgi:hypothetical protein
LVFEAPGCTAASASARQRGFIGKAKGKRQKGKGRRQKFCLLPSTSDR